MSKKILERTWHIGRVMLILSFECLSLRRDIGDGAADIVETSVKRFINARHTLSI
jgi:hypothetical protein